jgi:hypothetical protein
MNATSLGKAMIARDAMALRAMAQDILRDPRGIIPYFPDSTEASTAERAGAAAVLDLLATRSGVAVPDWVKSVPPLDPPMFAVATAETMPRLRALCLAESPEPLRRRGFHAPPDFLTFA